MGRIAGAEGSRDLPPGGPVTQTDRLFAACAGQQGGDRRHAPPELTGTVQRGNQNVPHERSRPARAIRSHPSADERELQGRIFIRWPVSRACPIDAEYFPSELAKGAGRARLRIAQFCCRRHARGSYDQGAIDRPGEPNTVV
jgi:hypothetical protein